MTHDHNTTPLTRAEFAHFARVVQSAVNGVDSALSEAFEHVNEIQSRLEEHTSLANEAKELASALEALRHEVDALRQDFINISETTPVPSWYTPRRVLIASGGVSAAVSVVLSYLFRTL